ncbi:MAG TPA: DNA methyltransferase [Polyangiaceae bacterium]|nr:DNA methyltransferase [Polyangiaceae bacterium]
MGEQLTGAPKEIARVLSGECRWRVELGDCLDVLRTMPDACVDALVTDPPAGIGFMGKTWDHDRGGRDVWVAWLAARMREAYRVMKPGAHGLVWALPRTSHWTALALEDAGLEIRDVISHLFGSGFPKSLDVSKAVDKLAGAERDVIGKHPRPGGTNARLAMGNGWQEAPDLTAPATAAAAAAAALQGWGTALKPACEFWFLVRKPMPTSIARNVLEHGTGALNIDGCRVAGTPWAFTHSEKTSRSGGVMGNESGRREGIQESNAAGRWPAHLLFSHAEGCELVGKKKVKAAPPWNDNRPPSLFTGATTSPVHHTDGDGFETVDDWRCVDGCPVKELDEQSGALHTGGVIRQNAQATPSVALGKFEAHTTVGYDDEGGASRYFTTFAPFFYTPKADRADRAKGCEHLPVKSGGELTGSKDGAARLDSPRTGAGRGGGRRNTHPTVKSTDLMRWLCRLITPPGGVVLDMFAGSGSTLVACSAEGFRCIGIEADAESVEIACARVVGDAPLFNVGSMR